MVHDAFIQVELITIEPKLFIWLKVSKVKGLRSFISDSPNNLAQTGVVRDMARPLRIEFANAWYHVMSRGAGRRNTFLTDNHRELFLKLLGEATELFGLEVHA